MNVFALRLLVCGLLFVSGALAQAQDVHGVLRVVKGEVQIKSAKTGQTGRARLGEQVFPKDVVITGKDSRAKIVMVDNNEINVSPESQIEIQKYEFDPAQGKKEVLLNVIYGKVRSKVEQKYDGKTSHFQVKTPSAVAGVRGTDFLTSFNRRDNSSSVITFHGAVEFGVPGANGRINNSVSVTPGKMATSVAGAAPSAPKDMPKSELAKVDNDSKADTGGAKSERTPAGDGRDKDKDKEKKDDSKGRDESKGRGPASESSSGVLKEGDVGGSNIGAIEPPPPPPLPPPPPPLVPNTNVQNLIQNGKTNLNVHINRAGP